MVMHTSGLVAAAPIAAANGVTATLAGRPISLQQAGSLSCHDFDYPVLRCFSTPDALGADVTRQVDGRSVSTQGFDTAQVLYVTVYEHATYAGRYMVITADQPWLSSVGWNDMISSLISHGASGNFRENSPASGFIYFFSPTSQVGYVGDAYNDKFSSVYVN
jgi:hypothetical protein